MWFEGLSSETCVSKERERTKKRLAQILRFFSLEESEEETERALYVVKSPWEKTVVLPPSFPTVNETTFFLPPPMLPRAWLSASVRKKRSFTPKTSCLEGRGTPLRPFEVSVTHLGPSSHTASLMSSRAPHPTDAPLPLPLPLD